MKQLNNMKNLKQIAAEIKEHEEYGKSLYRNGFPDTPDGRKNERAYKSTGGRVAFLRSCQLYLESEPREEFVQKQLDELTRKKQLIEDGFISWVKLQPEDTSKHTKEWEAEYNSIMGTKTIKSQIKTLNYLLN